MIIRAVISARYSSDKQHDTSIEAQLAACRAYAQRKGYIVTNEYIDRAESGRFDDRPAYQQMLADAKKQLFDVVIFHKIDRNARNEYDYYFHKKQLQKNHVRIEYAEQSFDNTPEGQMMENMIVGVSAYYSRNLARETMKVLTIKANRAEFNGGTPPFGYSVKDKKYVINEQESLAVKTIFEMFLQGAGYSAICDWLTTHGFKTRRGRYFGKNSLHDLLKNEKYIGVYVYGKVQRDIDGNRTIQGSSNEKLIRQENALPAIIENETFRRVQDIMNQRKNAGRQYHECTTTYLLAGLATCSYCGSKMIGTKVKNGQYFYYRCNKKERHADAGKCPTPMIPKDQLENLVLAEIWDRLLNPKTFPILIKDLNKQVNEQIEKNHALIDNLQSEEKKLLKKLDRFYNMIEETGKIDPFDRERMQQTKDRITAVREELVSTCIQTENITIPESMIREVIQDWSLAVKQKDPDRIRAMLQNVVNKIVVNPDYSVVIQLKIVCLELVPRTGIEPVR